MPGEDISAIHALSKLCDAEPHAVVNNDRLINISYRIRNDFYVHVLKVIIILIVPISIPTTCHDVHFGCTQFYGIRKDDWHDISP
jgi:hypothetical protein